MKIHTSRFLIVPTSRKLHIHQLLELQHDTQLQGVDSANPINPLSIKELNSNFPITVN